MASTDWQRGVSLRKLRKVRRNIMNIDPARIVSAEILSKRDCPACQSRVAPDGTIDYKTLTQVGLCEVQTCLICQGQVVRPAVDITKIATNT